MLACPPTEPVAPTCPDAGGPDCPTSSCVNPNPDGSCADCSNDSCSAGTLCHPEIRRCVQCAVDSDCAVAVCHPAALVCVSCWNDSQCPDGVCGTDNVCIQCAKDEDCSSGICNIDAGSCVGGCRRDSDCNDSNPCTVDRCTSENACTHENLPDGATCDELDPCLNAGFCLAGSCVASQTDCCPDPPECGALSVGTDTNADGCVDRCICVDGAEVGPEGLCVPICNATAVACPEGAAPSDEDGDGCADECACVIDDCTPCATSNDCDDGEACTEDLCVNSICVSSPLADCGACESSCDCLSIGAADAFATPCPIDCPTCGNYWACKEGKCAVECGVQPAELAACTCDPIVCAASAKPTDTTGDGCPDTCICEDGQPAGPGGCPPPKCESSCDCFELLPQNSDACADTCAGCANQWICVSGGCQEICGQAPVGTVPCAGAELCTLSGGQWVAEACGDYECGVAPACSSEPSGGCDCGSDATFDPLEGCKTDDSCISVGGLCPTLTCSAKLGTIDADGDGCPDLCVCDTNSACEEEELCLKPTGECDSLGTCAARPANCGPVGTSETTVCGCDNLTYSSPCEALANGVNVSTAGACP